jgi:hypothetical protein
MKTMSATLVLLGLTICSAAAEDTYRSTMSGNLTIEVAPKDADKAPADAKAGEDLTIRFVPPPKPTEPDEDDIASKLQSCGEKWNKKLKAYDRDARKREKYLAYSRKWGRYAAQRPPRLDEPKLTRTIYRVCMYACLQNQLDSCPGGWAADGDEKTAAKK